MRLLTMTQECWDSIEKRERGIVQAHDVAALMDEVEAHDTESVRLRAALTELTAFLRNKYGTKHQTLYAAIAKADEAAR